MNKMIVLHGLNDAFNEAFALKNVGVGSIMPSVEDALKYQITFLMMSGYTPNEAIALLSYGVKKGLVQKHGVKWFLKLKNDELLKILQAVRREGLSGLGFIPKRWLPRGLRKLQVGKAVGDIARNVIAPVARIAGTVLTATGIGAPIGAALVGGGTLLGTLAKEGGAKASDVANAVLGVAAATSGQGTLPTNVQTLVNKVANQNPEIRNLAKQINTVMRDPQVNLAVNQMSALIPKSKAQELQANVPPNFLAVAQPNPIETNMQTITTTDLRPIANRSSATPNEAGFLRNPAVLIGGVALLGIGLILSSKK